MMSSRFQDIFVSGKAVAAERSRTTRKATNADGSEKSQKIPIELRLRTRNQEN